MDYAKIRRFNVRGFESVIGLCPGLCVLLLASQASARRDILDSPASKSIYLDYLEDIIGRPVDTAADINRYEKMLDKARSKVDFAIAEQVYMSPSDMLLKMGNIQGYNNNLLIADDSIKIGVINHHINTPKHVPIVKHIPHTSPEVAGILPQHEKKQATDHNEEKESLIIVGISAILLTYYFL